MGTNSFGNAKPLHQRVADPIYFLMTKVEPFVRHQFYTHCYVHKKGTA